MLKQRKKAIMFPFLWTPKGTLWCSTNAPRRVIKEKIDPLFYFYQDLAIYVVRKEDTGIVFFVFPAKSRLPTKTQIIAKTRFSLDAPLTHIYVLIVLLEFLCFIWCFTSPFPTTLVCGWVIFDAAKPFLYEIPIVKLVPLRLIFFSFYKMHPLRIGPVCC